MFRVVHADPAWRFRDKLPGPGRGAEKHYPTMNIKSICAIKPPVTDDALLLLWRVTILQADALLVMAEWGFDLAGEIVWIKVKKDIDFDWDDEPMNQQRIGMGHVIRNAHEVCLVGTRGNFKTVVRNMPSWFAAPVTRHSRKPPRIYQIAMELSGAKGPRLDLFSREIRPGWVSWGNEIGKDVF